MRALIAEDEPLAADLLRDYLGRYDPDAEVVAVVESCEELVAWLRAHGEPDLLISDIQLQDGDVFGAFDRIAPACPIIFATAYDSFVLQAFEQSGIAYLLKPFDYEQFRAALDKYRRLGRAFQRLAGDFVAELRAALSRPEYRRRLVVKRRSGLYLLAVEDIAYIRVRDETTSAYDSAGREHPVRETLRQLGSVLDPACFFRLNRSEMVSARYIERLEPYGRDRMLVRLRDLDETLISSAARTPDLRRWLNS